MDPIKYFTLSMIIFILGIWGTLLNRRNILIMLMSLELMLLAVNLNFLLFSVSNIVSSKEEMILAAFFIGLFLWTWERGLSPFHRKSFLLFTLLSPRVWGFFVYFLSFLFFFLLHGFLEMGAPGTEKEIQILSSPWEEGPRSLTRDDFFEIPDSPKRVAGSSSTSAGVVDPHAHVDNLPALPEVRNLDPEQPPSSEVVVQVEESSSTLPQRGSLSPKTKENNRIFEEFSRPYRENKWKEFFESGSCNEKKNPVGSKAEEK